MNLLEILFPQNLKCIFCGKEDGGFGICDRCMEKLPFIKGPTCKKCGVSISSGDVCIECKDSKHKFERVYSIFDYSGRVRNSILKIKQNGLKYLANPFSYIMFKYFENIKVPFEVIIPMPIHENRLKERGFNQSELLLKDIEKNYGRVYKNLLVRTKDTPHQTGLGKANRESNLDHAFKVTDKQKVKGKIILLVDDIYTTGSTLNECAKTFKRAGASKVFALCLARTPINKEKILNKTTTIDFRPDDITKYVI